MKKIVTISLCLIIVLLSFEVCFADNAFPIILPVGDGITNSLVNINGYNFYASTNNSPTYIVFYYNTFDGHKTMLAFSETPSTKLYFGESPSTYNLSSGYNGFYYSSWYASFPESASLGSFNGNKAVIEYLQSNVFDTTFNLTYLVNGSISWLSTFAQAVKNSPLLLFFVIFIFVGIGIGLLNRFARR